MRRRPIPNSSTPMQVALHLLDPVHMPDRLDEPARRRLVRQPGRWRISGADATALMERFGVPPHELARRLECSVTSVHSRARKGCEGISALQLVEAICGIAPDAICVPRHASGRARLARGA